MHKSNRNISLSKEYLNQDDVPNIFSFSYFTISDFIKNGELDYYINISQHSHINNLINKGCFT
jgi:hypothetical protein